MDRVHPNAEPGTGTQCRTIATPARADDDLPNSKRINGRRWKVGLDYLDTDRADVCELVAIIRKSTWCDTRDVGEAPIKLVFNYERIGSHGPCDSQVELDPNDPDYDFTERFIERYTEPHGRRP